MHKLHRGFTIVELLVVVAVIGILATILVNGLKSYSTESRDVQRQSRAQLIATALESYYTKNGEYPGCTAMTAAIATVATNTLVGIDRTALQTPTNTGGSTSVTCTNLLNAASDTFAYIGDNNTSCSTGSACVGYILKYIDESDGTVKQIKSNKGSVTIASGLTCPSGFIVVPGSGTYGTSDFCVMKYEAKQSSGTVPISQAAGNPWTSISAVDAKTYSANVAGCTGCHMITEAEWLTIAQNLMNVASNWSGGAVGSGYMYYGHSDNSPASGLAASTDDTMGYINTGNCRVTPASCAYPASSSESNTSQERTLTLSNGNIIWDFSGDVEEFTDKTISSSDVGLFGFTGTANWNTLTGPQISMFAVNPLPSNALAAAASWTKTQGIGRFYIDPAMNNPTVYTRGGSWSYSNDCGIFSLDFDSQNTDVDPSIGFRVTK